ncbi:MAG: 2-phosphosulfolactate phosphatase [candidate division Zixibacteria bacterium]|nr:2-phosphosulfolactate phosphatase [candidate division Zixibacteria bacterium]
MKIELYLTPVPLLKADLNNKAVVVIDVLRSSTSVCAALWAGARGVIPTDGPGEAGEMWAKLGGDMAILAGERHGVKIDNFQLGNSPAEFTRQAVGGKFVVMTTTNGTAVYIRTRNASPVICGGLVNISKTAERLSRDVDDVAIACTGNEGSFSIEDTVCGGMLIHTLATRYDRKLDLNDAASLALLLYRSNKSAVKRTIEQGEHGRYLASIGFAGDVEIAANVDSMPVLPVLRDGRLVKESE